MKKRKRRKKRQRKQRKQRKQKKKRKETGKKLREKRRNGRRTGGGTDCEREPATQEGIFPLFGKPITERRDRFSRDFHSLTLTLFVGKKP